MNMLRVWGGGIYEDDAFYDLCDELGLLVWQDFMFACSAYPAFDEGFCDNVRAEAEDNVRRLRHHPCIALWCGNNELEQRWVAEAWTDRAMSWADYGRLFDELLPDVVRRLDGERAYWPCSPHSPCGDRADHANPTCGDAHLWQVWHGRQPFAWYRTALHRFCSEFGFQSFAHPRTVRGFTRPADRNVASYVMEHHQRSGIGNTVIVQYLLDWFRLPKDFESLLRVSQMLQAVGIASAVEHWRRHMPRCMGALYWQLNDCWPAASWASIDFSGRWKALHCAAKRFFAPLLISAVADEANGTVDVHATSDRLSPAAARVAWTLTDVGGRTVAADAEPVRAPANGSRRVLRIDLADPLARYGPRDLLLWLELRLRGEVVATHLVTFAPPKHLELTPPQIRARVRRPGGGPFAVTLRAKRPALWTWLELAGAEGRFEDNFFHLRPGAEVTVQAAPDRHLTVDAFRKKLRIRSLFDTYR
jgi:beta-mannosidase